MALTSDSNPQPRTLGSAVNLNIAPIIKILRAKRVEIKEHINKHINEFLTTLERLTDR